MIIRASADFVKHFKCRVSHSGKAVEQLRRLDSWSAHVVTFRGVKLALLMNDATLYTLIIPLEDELTFQDFALAFFKRILGEWGLRGKLLDANDLSLAVLKRSNRTLIGSMSDAASLLHGYASFDAKPGQDVTWSSVENFLNGTPFSALNNSTPCIEMGTAITHELTTHFISAVP